jgi:ribonuclease HI
VDDTLIAVDDTDLDEYSLFLSEIKKAFMIEERGPAKWVLGVKIDYDKKAGVLKMSQQAYVEKILRRFGMDEGKKIIKTPALKIPRNRSDLMEEPDTDFPYLEAVGALLYAAYSTRPDILYAVNYAAQHASAPTDVDVNVIKRILKYLRSTLNLGMVYSRARSVQDFQLRIYADAAFDVNEGSKSQTGYSIMLGNCNIYSQSRKQTIIAQSSCEAEYIAMTEASNEAIGLKYLIMELIGEENFNPQMQLFTDSTAAITNATNSRQSKIRHINRRLNVIKERIMNGELQVQYIKTQVHPADLLTKPLSKDRFVMLRDALMETGGKIPLVQVVTDSDIQNHDNL